MFILVVSKDTKDDCLKVLGSCALGQELYRALKRLRLCIFFQDQLLPKKVFVERGTTLVHFGMLSSL